MVKVFLESGHFSFKVVRPLGEGGLGRVDEVEIAASRAHRKPVGSRWARKRLNSRFDQVPEMRERFEREILALRGMAHPNIVTLEGENLPGGERFYLMPVYSSTLRTFIGSGRWLGNCRDVARSGVVLARALAYAHSAGHIHRDFKPDNVLFNAQEPLVIADWGLGYFIHKESKVLMKLTRGGMGTEYYCCLEQWGTGKCDVTGDIYSLGMTLDEWLHGSQRAITVGLGLWRQSPAASGDSGARMHQFLQAMTEILPENRPQSMREVADRLSALSAG